LCGTPWWVYEAVYCVRGQAENLMAVSFAAVSDSVNYSG
jgi:hypothetical protein